MEGLDKISNAPRITYRTVRVLVAGPNNPARNETYTLEGNIQMVTGIAVKADKVENDARAYDLQIGADINGKNVLPNEFEGSLLFCSPAVPTQNRFLELKEPRGGGKVVFTVVDRNESGSASFPYVLTFTLRCTVTD